MRTIFKTSLLILFFAFISCENDDDTITPQPEGEFSDGFFVVNNGGFNGSYGISFISNDFNRVEQNIFSSVNAGENLGLFPQSMFFDLNGLAYIISNGSNLITVVNRFGFQKVAEITTNLDNPRYGVVVDGKAYVTNSASFDTTADDFVTVINLGDFSVETTIPILEAAEFIITDGALVYVQNASFGTGSGITVINPLTNSIETKIETGENLQNVAINANTIFALHENGIDAINLSSQEISSTITMESGLDSVTNLRVSNGQFYYTDGNSIYTSSLGSAILSDEPLITYESAEASFIYGFDVNDGLIYIADAKDFASDGKVLIYDLNGDLVFETMVGLSPNGFYFNSL